jgi:hypothetical protein
LYGGHKADHYGTAHSTFQMKISYPICIEQRFISQAESALNWTKMVEELACLYVGSFVMLLRVQIYYFTKLMA